MTTGIVSDTACMLGEGPLWHPERQSLFWFDILGQTLHEHDGATEQSWSFDRPVSAAGWVDRDTLLIATARDLIRFDLVAGQEDSLVPLEADNPGTRSNDGRADPWGGFWIGTMGLDAQPKAGAIYRYFQGTLHPLFDGLTITNAICFAPDGRSAYFCDTAERIVQRVALDAEGWPDGVPEPFLDLTAEGLNPDGAVTDAEGRLWIAQWGAHRVACYDLTGTLVEAIDFPAANISCPAFGGPDLRRLYATSARQGADPEDSDAGKTFSILTPHIGRAEPPVRL